MAGHLAGEANALSERKRVEGSERKRVEGSERKRVEGSERKRVEGLLFFSLSFLFIDDDVIVVRVPFVYILRCADGVLYVGHTIDLEDRVRRHGQGAASSFTVRRRPVALVYWEELSTLAAAISRERQLKRWTRRKKEALIAGDSELLKRL
jgi:predicted GIY-YIG superfamily endonuclease